MKTHQNHYFLLQIKQNTTYIVFVHKQSISKLYKHKIKGFGNCCHKMWLMAANIWFSKFNLVTLIGVNLFFIYHNYLLNEHWKKYLVYTQNGFYDKFIMTMAGLDKVSKPIKPKYHISLKEKILSRFKHNLYLAMINSIIPFNDINTKGLHLKNMMKTRLSRERLYNTIHTRGDHR